jgi:hypothetical protein
MSKKKAAKKKTAKRNLWMHDFRVGGAPKAPKAPKVDRSWDYMHNMKPYRCKEAKGGKVECKEVKPPKPDTSFVVDVPTGKVRCQPKGKGLDCKPIAPFVAPRAPIVPMVGCRSGASPDVIGIDVVAGPGAAPVQFECKGNIGAKGGVSLPCKRVRPAAPPKQHTVMVAPGQTIVMRINGEAFNVRVHQQGRQLRCRLLQGCPWWIRLRSLRPSSLVHSRSIATRQPEMDNPPSWRVSI